MSCTAERIFWGSEVWLISEIQCHVVLIAEAQAAAQGKKVKKTPAKPRPAKKAKRKRSTQKPPAKAKRPRKKSKDGRKKKRRKVTIE